VNVTVVERKRREWVARDCHKSGFKIRDVPGGKGSHELLRGSQKKEKKKKSD
jgi:hypothetical protein